MKIIEQRNIGSFNYVRYDLSDGLSANKKMGVIRPAGESNAPRATLYLFHGGTGDDTQPVVEGFFDSLDSKTINTIRAKGLQIVLPYIATSFLHDSVDSSGMNYAEFFFNEVVPAAEGATRDAPPQRLISGVSMGGFAALSAFFKNPEHFLGVGTLAPALFDIDLFNTNAVTAYTQETGAIVGYMAHMTSGVKAVFRNDEDFRRASPNALAEHVPYPSLRGKTIYLNVGNQDEFGLSAGASALSRSLFKRDIAHELVIVNEARHDMAYANSQFQSLIQAMLNALS